MGFAPLSSITESSITAQDERGIPHTVSPEVSGERLDRYLTRVFPRHSRSEIQRWIRQGRVSSSGKPLKVSHPVVAGEKLSIALPAPSSQELKAEPIPLQILHEDDWLIVLDKPAGLVVHPAPGHSTGTLVHALLHHGTPLSSLAGKGKPGIVHRLDRDTSGLMVVAKEDVTHAALKRQFANRQVRRVYLALVEGRLRQDEGVIAASIGRHPVKRKQMAVGVGKAREAITRYRVLQRFAQATWVELYPETGRTHQLRVHLKHLGHPILGDVRYGGKKLLARQALHAHRLGFEHPGLHQWVEFVSPVPPELQKALLSLRAGL